jgi:hypothetical protein
MNRKYIDYLLNLVLALWLIPWIGKQYFPQIFGGHYVQWTCAILLAILIPIGTLLTISFIRHSEKNKLSGYLSLIGLSVPLLVILFSIVVALAVITNVQQFLYDNNDNLAIRSLSECSHNASTVEKRKNAAQYLYGHYGIKATFIDENNTLKIYSITKQDEDAWKNRQLEDKDISDKKEQINRELKTLPWLFTLYTATYAIIMIIGAAILIFRNPVKKKIVPDA